MSLQSQYIIGLHRDENPTKNRSRHNIACLLGSDNRKVLIPIIDKGNIE